MGRTGPDTALLGSAIEASTSLPIGSIVEMACASPVVDDKYLLCAGGVINKTDWPELEGYVPPFTTVSSLSQVDLSRVFPCVDVLGLEFFNGSWWMLNAYHLSKSSDAINWTVVLTTTTDSKFTKLKVSGDSAKLIICAGTYFKYSTDGVTWQTCVTAVLDVDTNGTRWIKVITGDTKAYYSDNLTTWTQATGGTTLGKTGVVYFSPGAKWVVTNAAQISANGFVQYSNDGVTFSDVTGIGGNSGTTGKLKRVGNSLLCTNAGFISYQSLQSTDGAVWSNMSYMLANATYANNVYYGIRYLDTTHCSVYSGPALNSPSTSIASMTSNLGFDATTGSTYGHIAVNPSTGDIVAVDRYGLVKRISSVITYAEIAPCSVSEKTADSGMYAFAALGTKAAYTSLHFIDFPNGLFVINAGVLGLVTPSTYVAMDKVFAQGTPHFWMAVMGSASTNITTYKITVSNNVCTYTGGNTVGDATNGFHGGIKTPGPNRYAASKINSGGATYVCTEITNSFTGIAGSGGNTNNPRMSIADGICSIGPSQIGASTVSTLSGLGTTNKATGATTVLTPSATTLSTVANGNAIYCEWANYFYRPGPWGLSDMSSAGPTPGANVELNQCAAGYFLIGQSVTLFSIDGYNWSPLGYTKSTNGISCPVSYADGKLFLSDGYTMYALAASDYDAKTQIQLPNIKSSKPGINTYIKAA